MMARAPARQPGLDLARALAIGAVLVCHCLVIAPSSPRTGAVLSFLGETGVNLFFALSGFLIGRIALRRVVTARDAGHFWMRRWFRTLPAGLAVAVVVALVLRPTPLYFASTVTFTRNLFRSSLESPVLPHYWSLAVEEWFYLLLPLLLLAIGRSPRRLAWLCMAWLALAAFHVSAAMLLDLGYWKQATLTWMRLDAILAGVIAAEAEPWLRGRLGRALCAAGWCGIAALFAAMLFVDPVPSYDDWLLRVAPRGVGDLAHAAQASVVPVLFAMTLPAMGQWRPARAQHGLEWRAVQVLALLTYSLYLVHWDLYRFAAHTALAQAAPLPACAAAVLASLAVAWLAYVSIERPFLRLRDRLAPEQPAQPQPVALGMLGRQHLPTVAK